MLSSFSVYAIRVLALLFAIIPHEVAHGVAAYQFGDTTAKRQGRLSFNPLNHIDPLGLLFMVVFHFGWAKAVPININAFRNRRAGLFVVSVAGVVTNFILGLLASILWVKMGGQGLLGWFLEEVMWYNTMLGVFNLVPLPPLDGSKVLLSFLPYESQDFILQNERYIYILLVIGVMSGFIGQLIAPVMEAVLTAFIQLGLWL
ncbi:site-2 protease family protein [Peptoniphilus equinus]|uniref:Site-2 protease family protein n=1 Tax=Peptoniphilus equinus TaxID=3016343 RepID=A0ABY7QUZ8_9FIRM|nr:site-2 protease family protein [Peptoniphilus equinus]WBW50601.1 site-2 protease family protein [Peptoniphilus equinus]